MYPEAVREKFDNKNVSMIVVFFKTSTSDSGSLEAIKEIRAVNDKNCYPSGLTACIYDLRHLCEGEELKYVIIAVLLSLLIMMFLLDSYLAPFIFLLCIGVAIMYNMGSNIFFGKISYIIQAIAAVLQLVGGTDIVAAIINKYRNITLERVMMICDTIIITSSYMVLKDWEKVVYGFVTLYVCSFMLDQIVNNARQNSKNLRFL